MVCFYFKIKIIFILIYLATGDVVVFLDAHCEANTGW
jgi:hypothetical protein